MTQTVMQDVELDIASRQRSASLFLVVATALWGLSFTWTKVIVELINHRLGKNNADPDGAIVLTGVRLALAGIIWFAVFPASRRGWGWRSLGRGVALGTLMAAGLLLQTLALGRTSVAVASFLTSLTVLFVPMLAVVTHLKLPPRALVGSVLLATGGIWLLTGATPAGFGVGEVLGLASAVAYTFHILLINVLLRRDDPFRLSGAMLLSAGLFCLTVALIMVPKGLQPALYVDARIWPRLLSLVILGTVAAFGIQMIFQPRIDPTRAAILYLLVPIFAALYAYVQIGERLTLLQVTGAALIIVANFLAEALATWGPRRKLSQIAAPTRRR